MILHTRTIKTLHDNKSIQQTLNFHFYSFLIGGDGNVYEGRGWNVEGAHTYNFNDVGYGICFIGDFMEVLPEQSAQNMYFNLTEVYFK